MSTAATRPAQAYQTLTAKLRNDGTTVLDHAEHAFRYISLYIPLSGTATDRLSRPGRIGPVSESLEVLQTLFPGVQQSAVVHHRGVSTMKLKFSNLEQLRAARLEGWRLGFLPEYPSGRGPGRILPAERLDHLVVTGVMATSTQEAVDTIMRRLRGLTKTGASQVCAPINAVNVSEKSPGRFTLYIDAYGLASAESIYELLNGKPIAAIRYAGRSRPAVRVFGEGPLALCQLCCRRGHKTAACNAPSLYLQCDSNGLDDDFCAFIKGVLDGASRVFAGTTPMRKGDKTFGFAVFGEEVSVGALAGAAALYTDGALSHIPRLTSGVHACRDCGQLDDDAQLGGRAAAHSSAESPLCGLHRREVLSGKKFRPRAMGPTRATPQFVNLPKAPNAKARDRGAHAAPPERGPTAMTDDEPPHDPAAHSASVSESTVMIDTTDPVPSVVAGRAVAIGATVTRRLPQPDMPPPPARPPTVGWRARMAAGRRDRSIQPPQSWGERGRKRAYSAPDSDTDRLANTRRTFP
jgi:hypothetical protein